MKLYAQADPEKNDPEKKVQAKDYSEGAFRYSGIGAGYFFNYYVNKSNKVLNEEFELTQNDGLTIVDPYKNDRVNTV